MKNLRVKVIERCDGFSVGLFEGRKHWKRGPMKRKHNAIRYAKVIAKKLNIPYDPEIIKQHGC